jgi:hypothetical protein
MIEQEWEINGNNQTASLKIIQRNGEAHLVIIDLEDHIRVISYRWYIQNLTSLFPYVRAKIKGEGGKGIYLHQIILGKAKNLSIDHLNGNGLDNRKINLKYATPKEQGANRKERNLISNSLPIKQRMELLLKKLNKEEIYNLREILILKDF